MIRIEHLVKYYPVGGKKCPVLQGITWHVPPGALVALVGQSGSGKSTLLHIIGLLDTYCAGAYYLQDQLIKHLTPTQAAAYRNQWIGFIFQQFHLISFKTVVDNVALPLYYRGVGKTERIQRAHQVLERVGLSAYARQYPPCCPGGNSNG